jgi:4-amino-4-deoxy-L-arabinose transferase-like glycosyltransferase
VLGLTAIYTLLATIVPPADDEYYYWCWAQSLQWSYYDHPLMSALFIRASGEIFGHSMLALRLPACLTTAVVFAAILWLTRPRDLAWWLFATPLFSLGAGIITPDTPLLFFWALYVVWLVKVHERLDEPEGSLPFRYWLLGGLLLGGGVLGKYTMGLAVAAGFLSFLLAASWRRWLTGYVLHGLVAFAAASPILIHNVRHDFAPLLYQWSHSMGQSDPSLAQFGDFLGIQTVLFGTLPLVLFPWVLWNARTFAATPRLRVCLCLYGFPFAFFLYKATRGHLEGNWALASYIAFWPLAAEWHERNRGTSFGRWSMRLSFLPPALAVAFLTIHFLHPLPFIKPESDRITRQAEKGKLAGAMAEFWKEQPLPLYTETYQWVALLRFHGIDARQIEGVSRPSHFTQTPQHITDEPEAYVLWENALPPKLREGLQEPILIKEFPLVVRGRTLTVFYLWKARRQ